MNIKSIFSDRVGHFVLEFDDDNSLSLLFSNGSHTENHYGWFREALKNLKDSSLDWLMSPVTSTTLEIMPRGDKIIKICSEYKEYWNEPLLDYFPVEKLIELLDKLKGI